MKHDIKTVNPLKHPYPHAKLYNITLTKISRLRVNAAAYSAHLTK